MASIRHSVRVGILSMQRIYNYGSFLQAFGLKSIMEELGCDVQFVDYIPGKCIIDAKSTQQYPCRSILRGLEAFTYGAPFVDAVRYILFKKNYGQKMYPLLGLTSELNLYPEIDMLIIGSDEVFNCIQSNPNVGYTPALFGAESSANRTVTYAASFGNTTLEMIKEHHLAEDIGRMLHSLDAISVRDENSLSIVQSLGICDVDVNLDPVLISDLEKYATHAEGVISILEEYIVIYGYSGRFSKEECEEIRAFAKKRKLRVINIGGIQACCDQFVDCDPFEVITYFKNAYCIITDTFHGTILSVITHQRFGVLIRDERYGNSQKLSDLINRLDIKDAVIMSANEIEEVMMRDIDFRSVDISIAKGKVAARVFLKKQICQCVTQ